MRRKTTLKFVAPWSLYPSVAILISVGFSFFNSLYATLIFLMAMLSFLVFGWRIVRDRNIIQSGHEVEGKVIEVFPIGRYPRICVEYSYSGCVITSWWSLKTIFFSRNDFSVGQKVTVFVHPSRPELFVVLEGSPFAVHA